MHHPAPSPGSGPPPVAEVRLVVPGGVALPRPRLERALERLWLTRAGLVQGPAGSGKTTLVAQFAREQRARVAWYRAEAGLATREELDDRLRRALVRAGVVTAGGGPGHAHDLVTGLPAAGHPALLVVDDLHVLDSEVADPVFDRLLTDGPPWLRVLFASRAVPTVNLPQLRLEDRLVELGGDDLRFRPWETERLFRDLYGDVLPPEDAAELTRRTEGWAAGLQMFHLAARGKTAGQRRELVTGISTRSRFVRDYLARNVLRDLDHPLRRFLVDSCVLGLLTGPLCDALLERTGSGALLDELERRQVFTASVDGGLSYRYHEVLRGYLEQTLVAEVGEAETRSRFRRAGGLLEAAGAVAEAVRAFAQAGDWPAVARLLGVRGGQVADSGPAVSAGLVAALPGWLLDDDPWLLLAGARREVSAGRWAAAVERYRRAEQAFGPGPAADRCRRERAALLAWTEPCRPCPPGWAGVLRQATRRDPAAGVTAPGPTAGHLLARGLAALLSGDLAAASHLLWSGARAADADPLLAGGLELAARLSDQLRGTAGPAAPPGPGDVEARVEALGVPALTRVARLVTALGGRSAEEGVTAAVGRECEHAGDSWGAAFSLLCDGVLRLLGGVPTAEPLERAAEAFAALDAPVLQAWSLAIAAAARAARGDPGTGQAADLAVRRAGGCACAPARALALAALARGRPDREPADRARAAATRCGLAPSRLWSAALPEAGPGLGVHVPPPRSEPAGRGPAGAGPDPGALAPVPAVAVRCFGGLQVEVAGVPLDLSGVRPRARSALRVLALRAGSGVHRERLADALWPDDPPAVAARGVQVAVSSLRRLLAGSAEVRRDGEGYALVLPAGALVDVEEFRAQLAAARRASGAGEHARAAERLAAALQLYRGDLFPEEGPAEWLVAEREQCRAAAVGAGRDRAEACLRLGRFADAAAACEDGLRIDRFSDPLWRLLLEAHERAGNPAAARLATARYHRSLEELGVVEPGAAPVTG